MENVHHLFQDLCTATLAAFTSSVKSLHSMPVSNASKLDRLPSSSGESLYAVLALP